jgi:ribosomal protein S8
MSYDYDKIEILSIPEKFTFNEIEDKLKQAGYIGQVNFIQSEKNGCGKIDTYWVNNWMEIEDIPATMHGDHKKYKTKLMALNAILNNI